MLGSFATVWKRTDGIRDHIQLQSGRSYDKLYVLTSRNDLGVLDMELDDD